MLKRTNEEKKAGKVCGDSQHLKSPGLFKRRNGSNRYTHIKINSRKGYFTDTINPGGDNLYTADQICRMVEFLIDNIFVKFGGCLFCQVIGIPMGTNCAPLLADLFLYSYESEFLDMIRGGHRKLARSFNLCYRYIDDSIVFNNKKFENYVKDIYPSQLTVEKANTSDDLANYLDLTFIIESNNRLYTRLMPVKVTSFREIHFDFTDDLNQTLTFFSSASISCSISFIRFCNPFSLLSSLNSSGLCSG